MLTRAKRKHSVTPAKETMVKPTISKKCKNCNAYLSARPKGITDIKTEKDVKKFSDLLDTQIEIGDRICQKCKDGEPITPVKEDRAKRITKKPQRIYEEFSWGDESSPSDDSGDSDFNPENSDSDSASSTSEKKAKMDYIPVEPFQKIVSTYDTCFVCQSKEDLIEVPLPACQQLTVEARLFVPLGIQCCKTHLQNDNFSKEEIEKIRMEQRKNPSTGNKTSNFMK